MDTITERLTEGTNFRSSNPCPSPLLHEVIRSSIECKNEHNFKLVKSMNGTSRYPYQLSFDENPYSSLGGGCRSVGFLPGNTGFPAQVWDRRCSSPQAGCCTCLKLSGTLGLLCRSLPPRPDFLTLQPDGWGSALREERPLGQ